MKIITIALTFLILNFYSLAQHGITDLRSGIEIIFVTEEEMFPESWRENDINGEAGSLELSERRRSGNLVQQALVKYPIQLLNDNLKKIYVLSYLKFYDVEYGGTNSNDVVYLSNQGVDEGYSDFYIEQLFHHEFSSILYRNYASFFFNSKWECINDSDFVYGEGGVKEISDNEAGLDFNEDYHVMGFLYQYAMSGIENDLNSIAENLFCPHPKFWEVYDRYPKIRLKTDLVIKLYNSIDEDFNKEYFLKFAKE
ncbi:MAG TPA: hypothetical protein PLL66_00790 [Bacteroidales bacterium]|nr:hypothetical protein [Bacteroidales bacterium]